MIGQILSICLQSVILCHCRQDGRRDFSEGLQCVHLNLISLLQVLSRVRKG